jgi:alkylation response protein AidB-like acyl-CoA dehydrogenase
MATSTEPAVQGGGAWLLDSTPPGVIFTPERLTAEHRLVGRTAAEFVAKEVAPSLERLEGRDWDLVRRLLTRCGDLGLLGVDIPEAYGGAGLDKVSSLIVSSKIAPSASFAAAHGGQANLAAVPIFLFGTEHQRAAYLPSLMSGERVGAYALSEPEAGSDALSAKTRAARQPDGSFLLSGEKMWITNGGFADLFIVFAKVDGEHFTSFIVERAFGGVSSGKEEHKMGLHGSSTTAVLLQEVPVPAANLLGEVGKGHKVAFNVLNFGRLKLGAACCGGAQSAIGEAARYAAARRQFGRPIASFGAIQHKIGEMVVRTYALESLIFRTAGQIDAWIDRTSRGATDGSAVLAALEEFAVEASIAKVAGSEVLDFVLDENVQIHGGNGFAGDYPAERHFRDARVNRIFEGTNEINRLLIPGMLRRRAAQGRLQVADAAKALRDEILGPLRAPETDDSILADERRAVEAFKKVGVMIFGTAMETYGAELSEQQEVLMHVADILIDVLASESAVLRAIAAAALAVPRALLHLDAARIFVGEAGMRIEAASRQALAAMTEGDKLRTMLAALRRLLTVASTPVDAVPLRRRIADETVARGDYIF